MYTAFDGDSNDFSTTGAVVAACACYMNVCQRRRLLPLTRLTLRQRLVHHVHGIWRLSVTALISWHEAVDT